MRFFCLLALLFLWGCAKPGPSEADLRTFNRGVGLMGSFEYQATAELYAELLGRFPDWIEAKLNLAIATLNLQTPGSEDRALALFEEVLAVEPQNPRALYGKGLLLVYKGQEAEAIGLFETVHELVPNDPHAVYYLAQCKSAKGAHQEALTLYLEVTRLDPYLRSAYYGAFQAYQRLGDRVQAQAKIAQFQRLQNNPQARQVEFKYTRMGALAEVWPMSTQTKPLEPPMGPLLLESKALPIPAGFAARFPSRPALTYVDLNGDGELDLLAPSAWSKDQEVCNAVYLGGPGGLVPAPEHTFVRVGAVLAALCGDVNNDGFVDVYLCRAGQNQLWLGAAEGSFVLQNGEKLLGNGDFRTVNGALVDADHDGDLDLFLINADGPDELLNNNGDGTWRPLAQELGLTGPIGSQQVLFTDLDGDRDLDIVLVKAQPPHQVWLNNLLWSYTPAPGFEAFNAQDCDSVIAADMAVNGQVSLLAHQRSADIWCWDRQSDGVWKSNTKFANTSTPEMAWLDLTGSGRFELLRRESNDWVLTNEQGLLLEREYGESGVAAWTAFPSDPQAGPSLISMDQRGQLFLLGPGPGRFPFLSLSFTGAVSADGATRSNISGLGTRFAVRTGSQWAASPGLGTYSGAGQSLGPVSVGLGGASQCDYLALTWSDGVYQTELGLESGKHHVIRETQRQLASCPVLFAWDGKGYSFVSDVLGVGGLGFNLGKGEYASPRPWEHFQLPQSALVVDQGVLRLKLAEPMEESTYLDQAQLIAYELPPGWQMVTDERMATDEHQPTGQAIFYREERRPVRAHDGKGRDVTESLRNADLLAVATPEPDPRYLGLLREELSVELDFGTALHGPGLAWLVIDGWLEYPYSQTCFAAWQAGLAYESLSLEVPDGNGAWQTVLPQFGYPAGMPRRMTLALPESAKSVSRLRLRTNQEIYLDRISVVYGEACPEARSYALLLQAAQLKADGFAARTTGPQRQPAYDDLHRRPLWDTRHQSGFYTNYGEMGPLVAEADHALAILGPGEAVYLQFQDQPVSLGKTRVYVLQLQGWCKDMDLYTKDGASLEPLPSRDNDPHPQADQLQGCYNTRFQAGP